MKNIVIYHRASQIHSNDEIMEKINLLVGTIDAPSDTIIGLVVVWERADKVIDQNKLRELIRVEKFSRNNPKATGATKVPVDEIYSYTLNTLVNDNYVGAMDFLEEILNIGIKVRFFGYNCEEVTSMVSIYILFRQNRVFERNQLSAYRMQENGTKVGRRPKFIDLPRAIKLREEGKSFPEIAHALDCSTSAVYRQLPTQYRGWLPDRLKMRMRKLERRIQEKIQEEKEKENDKNQM